MNEDYEIIKEKYGEEFAKLCRKLFPTLLEKPGLLTEIITSKFYPNHYLYQDIINSNNEEEFKDYIYSLANIKYTELKNNKTVKELLDEAGYDFYECKSEEDIEKFTKYYAPGELLCTFNSRRLGKCIVFWAVSKKVSQIKRENMTNPNRQDEYGTSVISIQFTRGFNNTLSIKNRYNSTVKNPDATYSNNLENIIPGLTEAFRREYNLRINESEKTNLKLPNYVMANDRKFYKYNYEINNIYYCPNDIIIKNGEVIKLPREKYVLIDYFIIDLTEKTLKLYDEKGIYEENGFIDPFPDGFKDIKKILINKDKKTLNKNIIITLNNGQNINIEIDKFGRIIGLTDENLIHIKSHFLYYNSTLKNFKCENVEHIDDYVLMNNLDLETLSLPKVKEIGYEFLTKNEKLKILNLDKVEIIKSNSFNNNNSLKILKLPELKEVGVSFFINNNSVEIIYCKNLEQISTYFFWQNKVLKIMYIPKIEENKLDRIYANNPNVKDFRPQQVKKYIRKQTLTQLH